MTAHLALLLHMHQPEYVDPLTGRAVLPWVRLHGSRAYLDVAQLLDEHPGMRLTVNFVPSLVAQLEAVVGGASDEWLLVAEKPEDEWTPADRLFLVERLFSLHWGRSVDPRPRYRELLDKRGRHTPAAELPARAAQFSDGELRDLTVLFQLAWIGFAGRAGDAALAALETRGRGFSLDDLKLVAERQRAACGRVLPLYRRLADRGQIELTATPYYHPIVPLLIDSDHARRAQPELPLPPRFAFAEDAAAQIARGRKKHERSFGNLPAGLWPSEGSVSPEAVALYRQAGVRWLATDEGNLWRSRPGAPRGDLYRPHRFDGVDLVFRDREISDRIGFAYAHGDAAAGVADLLSRARAAAAQSSAPAGDPPLVTLCLDGENPWEAYPGGGEPFLRALFSALAADPTLRPVTISEHLDAAQHRGELPSLHSGSWIDSDFHIWIGDPIKNRAWELLGQARRRWERARSDGVDAERLDTALEHLYAAEGSDWFWWFGEPFHTAEDQLFDRLFRAHLAGAYSALGDAPPPQLARPLEPPRETRALGEEPFALIRPTILATGRPPGFYAWHGAGHWLVPRGAAMADTPLIEQVLYGFDRDTLFLRLDPPRDRAGALDAVALEVDLTIARTGGTERQLRLRADGREWTLAEAEGDGWRDAGRGGPAALHWSLELGVSFARLGARPGDRVSFAFRVLRGAVALGRYPADGALSVIVPDDAFAAEHWSA